MVLAELPPSAVPKCKAAPGFLGYLGMAKYGWHLPLHRLMEYFANQGFPVHKSTLWEWIRATAKALEPIYDRMKKELLESDIIASDETPVRLWNRAEKKMRTGRQWTYLDQNHTLFEFTPDRKSKWAKAFLADLEGYLLTDAYGGYRKIAAASNGKILNVFCWAHSRRQFWKARESDKERSTLAIAFIKTLYRIEDEADEAKLPPAKRKELRQKKSKPIVEQFKAWLEEQGLVVLPKSAIGKAMAYARRNWTELTRFLDDGRLRLDNNISEQQLRPIAVGRKNWLRYESERGGKAAAILGSLIASCRRHRKNPLLYLCDVLRRIATCPVSKVRDLVPCRWKPKPDTS